MICKLFHLQLQMISHKNSNNLHSKHIYLYLEYTKFLLFGDMWLRNYYIILQLHNTRLKHFDIIGGKYRYNLTFVNDQFVYSNNQSSSQLNPDFRRCDDKFYFYSKIIIYNCVKNVSIICTTILILMRIFIFAI